jgi:hypothetical protein
LHLQPCHYSSSTVHNTQNRQPDAGESFFRIAGRVSFPEEHSVIMKLIQYFTAINLIAYIGGVVFQQLSQP